MTGRWAWSVSGTQVPSGTVARPMEDSGIVEGELMGDVLVWLAEHGPFWGVIDDREPMTIHVRPVDADPTLPALPVNDTTATVRQIAVHSPQDGTYEERSSVDLAQRTVSLYYEDPDARVVVRDWTAGPWLSVESTPDGDPR